VAAPLFGVGAVLMAVEALPAQVPLVAARLLLVAFYYYFMIGLTFNAALRSNLLLIGAYIAAATLGHISGTVATYSLFVLLCANLIGGAGCYALEHANRVAFLERRRLAEVAMHDGLTGLLNRAALEEQARSLWEHARGAGEPVSVMLIDIDHFKAYNDCYGHQAGDRCLREVALTIRNVVRRRPLDLVARYGGEEIIAILVGGGRAEAAMAAQRVLQAIADLRLAHGGSPTRPYLTVSVGVSSVEAGGEYSHERAVRLADIALYASKGGGRHCWSFQDGSSAGTDVPASPAAADAPAEPAHGAAETVLLKTAS
jgi:diguanylate cyclase (GGDEF)-like protein